MQIKRLVIENFKSIERIELIEPNPFTVFVGPNGSGKSNIFEALEFVAVFARLNYSDEVVRMFGGKLGGASLTRRVGQGLKVFLYELQYSDREYDWSKLKLSFDKSILGEYGFAVKEFQNLKRGPQIVPPTPVEKFVTRFRRLYINAPRNKRKSLEYSDAELLSFSASNLELVLKRLLTNNSIREEIFEWLNLFVPGFRAVEIDELDELRWYEYKNERHFTKDLISDGTSNLLALLTVVYQSDEPQFICIEEPENGLHPQVQMTLVEFFRKICAEKGHYIWLNTHSEAIVRKLTTDEIVLVDKQDGITRTQQVKGMDIYDIPTDEAWLTGTLGGGLPW